MPGEVPVTRLTPRSQHTLPLIQAPVSFLPAPCLQLPDVFYRLRQRSGISNLHTPGLDTPNRPPPLRPGHRSPVARAIHHLAFYRPQYLPLDNQMGVIERLHLTDLLPDSTVSNTGNEVLNLFPLHPNPATFASPGYISPEPFRQ